MSNGAEGEGRGVGIKKRVIHIPDLEYLRLDPLAALMRLHFHSPILNPRDRELSLNMDMWMWKKQASRYLCKER